MRWTLVCIFRTPDNPSEATRAAASQLNQITAAVIQQPAAHQEIVRFGQICVFLVLWYFRSFSFLCCSDFGAPVMKWVNDLEWAWWGRGGDWGRREEMTNIDLSWMFSCLVGAVPNTSLHPIPSHYLHALTAVQWVSYRVINTSSRPHTAPTSSRQTPPNDSRRQTSALLLLLLFFLLPQTSVGKHFADGIAGRRRRRSRQQLARQIFAFKIAH